MVESPSTTVATKSPPRPLPTGAVTAALCPFFGVEKCSHLVTFALGAAGTSPAAATGGRPPTSSRRGCRYRAPVVHHLGVAIGGSAARLEPGGGTAQKLCCGDYTVRHAGRRRKRGEAMPASRKASRDRTPRSVGAGRARRRRPAAAFSSTRQADYRSMLNAPVNVVGAGGSGLWRREFVRGRSTGRAAVSRRVAGRGKRRFMHARHGKRSRPLRRLRRPPASASWRFHDHRTPSSQSPGRRVSVIIGSRPTLVTSPRWRSRRRVREVARRVAAGVMIIARNPSPDATAARPTVIHCSVPVALERSRRFAAPSNQQDGTGRRSAGEASRARNRNAESTLRRRRSGAIRSMTAACRLRKRRDEHRLSRKSVWRRLWRRDLSPTQVN